MLRFFRLIRRKLIEEDNMREYIWYAFGEILLVMIGILLALQVNNWNEARKLHIEEERILKSLQTEVSQSITQLESRFKSEKSTTEIIKILLMGGQSMDSLLAHPKVDSMMFAAVWFTVTEVPVMQTYSDLKSSGNISIIQNYEIREELSELQFGLNNLDRQQKDLLSVQQLRIDGIAINDLDFITLLSASEYKEFKSGEKNDYKAFISEQSIRNTLGAKLTLMDTALDIRNEIITSCKKLLKVIESELDQTG